MPQRILAIDAGSYSVKLLQAERSRQGIRLLEFEELVLAGTEVLTREESTSAVLKKWVESRSRHFDWITGSVSGLKAAFRVLEFPFLQKKKIDEAFGFELENYLPVSVEEIWSDHFILNQTESSSSVLACYTLRSDFERYLKMFADLELDPHSVGIENIDLAYLYQTHLLPDAPYLILDLGHQKTNLCLMNGSRIEGVRTISIGGWHLTQAILKASSFENSLADVGKLSWEAAQKIKESATFNWEQQDSVSKAVQCVMERLVSEIRQTLFSFSEKGVKPIEAIYLCGGTAKLAGFESYLSAVFRLNVAPLWVLDAFPHTLGHLQDSALVLVPALAQVLRMNAPRNAVGEAVLINLRYGEFGYTQDLQELSGQLKWVGFWAACILLFWLVGLVISSRMLTAREDLVAVETTELLKKLEKRPRNVEDAESALRLVSSRVKEIEENIAKFKGDEIPSALDVLRLLSENLASRDQLAVDVTSIKINEGNKKNVRIDMKTNLDDFKIIDEVKESIAKVSGFKNVTEAGKGDPKRFSILFDLEVQNAKKK